MHYGTLLLVEHRKSNCTVLRKEKLQRISIIVWLPKETIYSQVLVYGCGFNCYKYCNYVIYRLIDNLPELLHAYGRTQSLAL